MSSQNPGFDPAFGKKTFLFEKVTLVRMQPSLKSMQMRFMRLRSFSDMQIRIEFDLYAKEL